jgi:hypothetical protein
LRAASTKCAPAGEIARGDLAEAAVG